MAQDPSDLPDMAKAIGRKRPTGLGPRAECAAG